MTLAPKGTEAEALHALWERLLHMLPLLQQGSSVGFSACLTGKFACQLAWVKGEEALQVISNLRFSTPLPASVAKGGPISTVGYFLYGMPDSGLQLLTRWKGCDISIW